MTNEEIPKAVPIQFGSHLDELVQWHGLQTTRRDLEQGLGESLNTIQAAEQQAYSDPSYSARIHGQQAVRMTINQPKQKGEL
jgi:hypothetical protein